MESGSEDEEKMRKYGLIGGAFIALLSAGESLIPVVHADPVNEGTTVFAQNQRQFHVDGGSLIGELIPIASAGQYRSKDTTFMVDPSTITDSIVNPLFFIVQGIRETDDGWAYPQLVKPDPGRGILGIAVAVNDVTHTELFAVGSPTPQATISLHSRNTSTQKSPPPSCPSIAPNLCYSRTRYVTRETWYEDPVGIQVTYVGTQLVCQEYYLPAQVDCSGNDATDWYQPSAWYQVSHTFSWHYYNSQTWAEADSNAHFRNTQFPLCSGYPVDIYFQPNWSRDSATDNYSTGVTSWVTSQSSCKNLLSQHYYVAIG